MGGEKKIIKFKYLHLLDRLLIHCNVFGICMIREPFRHHCVEPCAPVFRNLGKRREREMERVGGKGRIIDQPIRMSSTHQIPWWFVGAGFFQNSLSETIPGTRPNLYHWETISKQKGMEGTKKTGKGKGKGREWKGRGTGRGKGRKGEGRGKGRDTFANGDTFPCYSRSNEPRCDNKFRYVSYTKTKANPWLIH
jgi:hypothetical protein